MNRKGTIAIGEILIMVVGIFAVAWAIGEVSADGLGQTSGDLSAGDWWKGDPTQSTYVGGDSQPSLPQFSEVRKIGDTYVWGNTGSPLSTTEVEMYRGFGYETMAEGSLVKPMPAATAIPTQSSSDVLSSYLKYDQNADRDELGEISLRNKRVDSPGETGSAGINEPPKDPEVPQKGGILNLEQGSLFGSLWQGIKWAGTTMMVVGLINLFASKSSLGKYTEALQFAAPAGVLVGKSLWDMTSKGGAIYNKLGGADSAWNNAIFENGEMTWGQGTSVAIGAAVAVAIFVMMYSEEKEKTITFTCSPWDAPSGGNDCEKCNNNKDLPCSEYQCKSLGQSCELQNPNTDSPFCTWVNRYDVVPPVITLWEDALNANLKFTPTDVASPQDKGTKIVSKITGNCIPAYTPLVIGIQTDEPAKCKVDLLSKRNMSDMKYFFGSSLFLYNHTFAMSVPGQTLDEETQTIELKNDGNVELYVKCEDSNGNENGGNFVFKFCVDPSEDTTAPQILGTNIINGMPVAFNTSSLGIELYTNEPADCRWDRLDKGDYEEMKGTMSCNQKASEINAQMVYTCKANLDGIKSGNGNENNFYFKCKDKPTAKSGRNTNAENYKLTLYGTQSLILEKVEPNGTTIKDNTDPIEVELTARTAAGYKDGASTCYYKLPSDSEYVQFFTTGGATHSQKLYFATGEYEFPIKCVDAGGNSDEKIVKFAVESDIYSPQIRRIFKEENNLRTITDEEAECVYDTLGCNYQFSDGIAMTTVGNINQYTEWKPEQTYYIKCRDKYGNQPDAGTCSLEIRMYDRI